jgi:hypothetical protein
VAGAYKKALDATVSRIAGLNLRHNGAEVPVLLRKLPEQVEGVDVLPSAYVCPAERPESWERFSTEGDYLAGRRIEVALFAASNRDPESNLGDHLDWRQAVADSFSVTDPLGSVPGVYRVDVEFGTVLDREAYMRTNVDVGGLSLVVYCVERPA